ncbi:MAG: hypothetical protein NUW37_20130 [Planctomycetes bacterium]|nr:hypothetical protein [Planctomycetota bacterium]
MGNVKTICLCLGFLWFAQLAFAEEVVLNNGARISGRMVSQDDDKIQMEISVDTGTATMTIRRSRIHRIYERRQSFRDMIDEGNGFLATKDFGEARWCFDEALKKNWRYPDPYIGIARSMVGEGDVEGAYGLIRSSMLLFPRDDGIRLAMAEVMLAAKDYDGARRQARYVADRRGTRKRDEALALIAKIDEAERLANLPQPPEQEAPVTAPAPAQDQNPEDDPANYDDDGGEGNLPRGLVPAFTPRIEGNNVFATELGGRLVEVTSQNRPGAPTIVRTLRFQTQYRRGIAGIPADNVWFAGAESTVDRARLEVVVDPGEWVLTRDSDKEMIIYGWWYAIKAKLPAVKLVIEVQWRNQVAALMCYNRIRDEEVLQLYNLG